MAGSPNYDHLGALTDERGIFEHALHDRPRREHGYCVDDVSRALIVVVREPEQTSTLARHTETYLRFLESALDADGRSHNRMNAAGEWEDAASLGDWWGRTTWGLGFAAVHAQQEFSRKRALRAFHRTAINRAAHLHAMVFAALGAAEVLIANPEDDSARHLLLDFVAFLPASHSRTWPWPEDRLRYANGAIAEAIIAAGRALDDTALERRGLELLEFLLDVETVGDGLSVTGSAGRSPGETGPLFDQQPIEVAAIADACVRAFEVTSDERWLRGVRLASSWFDGNNDGGIAMFDEATGAGYDGLERFGRNDNRGGESTLAALSTLQHSRRLLVVGSSVAAP